MKTLTVNRPQGASVLAFATSMAQVGVAALSLALLYGGTGLAHAQVEAPAQAQGQQPGDRAPAQSTPALPLPEGPATLDMVNVDLGAVASRIADHLKVDVSQIPLSVLAPVRVAANVCNVALELMAQYAEAGGASCTADHTTSALDAIVDGLMKR